MPYLLVYLIVGVICGFISKSINENRGGEGGFWWGALLGIIGIVVVAVRPMDGANVNTTTNATSAVTSSAYEDLQKAAQLHEQGILSDEEFNTMKSNLLRKM